MNSHAPHAAELSGPPHIHHMDSTTAYGAAKLGMWLFLATEILLFGAIFTAFAIYRWMYLEEFHNASLNLNWILGALNTTVLLASSYTAALAVNAAKAGDNAKVRSLLLLTMSAGVVFLIVKYFEYNAKYHHGLFPAGISMSHIIAFAIFMLTFSFLWAYGFAGYHFGEKKKLATCIAGSVLALAIFVLVAMYVIPAPVADLTRLTWGTPEFASKYGMYFGLYYCMTALHALHVIIGMAILFWVFLMAKRNRFGNGYHTPVEVGALYWHLVDLIWIYLFPLLYLVE
jgi:cytochrome c oxidase subunit 3